MPKRLTGPALPTLALALTSASLLAGCASIPGKGADITYHLPQTNVSVGATLTLLECTPLRVDAVSEINATPGAQDTAIHFDAASLPSVRIERDLTINTYENLVISGVNAQATDRTGDIIASGLKAVLAFKPGAAVAGFAEAACNEPTRVALKRVRLLTKAIDELTTKMGDRTSPVDPAILRELNARLREREKIRTGLLQVTTGRSIPLNKDGALHGKVEFAAADFDRWFGPDATQATINSYFPVDWTAVLVDPAKDPSAPADHAARSCRRKLAVPAPTDVKITIAGTKSASGIQGSAVFPVAQLNDARELCIDVGLFEKRGIELEFDKFGRTTKLHWSSAATGANAAAALAGSAPDVKALLARSPKATVVDQQKAEIERLKTLQEYNALKACEAILAAGGADCSAGDQ